MLSDEHFISFGLLARVCKDDRGLYVRGLGRDPTWRWIQPERVVSRVLCTAHNSALAPYDAFIGEFGDELLRTVAAVSGDRGISTVVRFDGQNLERWMLKALCGLVASGQAARQDGAPLDKAVPDDWVRWLFGQADILPPLGLYFRGEIGDQQPIGPSVTIGPITTAGGKVVGLEFSFEWWQAVLVLVDWQGTATGAIRPTSIRRPQYVALKNENGEHRVEFAWPHSPGPGVELTYTRGTPG